MALKIAGNDSFKMKNIADLQQLDTLPSSATVIVEHGGFAKRFSAQNLGKVKTVNGIEPDENGNIEVAGGTGGTGGASIQPDWNQNDETAADYVKNRTHYSNGFVEKTYLPETTTVARYYTNLLAADIIPDNTYIVTWDGVDYECVSYKSGVYTDEDGDMIGNQLFAGTSSVNSGDPFLIGEWEENTEDDSIIHKWVIEFTENKVHTIKVSKKNVDGDNVIIEEILSETELSDYESYPMDYNDYFINIDIGNTCTVVWDGNEYECIVKEATSENLKYLGNLSIPYFVDEQQNIENTGEPFFIFAYLDDNYWTIFHETIGIYTIEIKGLVENVKMIDPKYLPKGGFGYESIETVTIVDTDVDIDEDLCTRVSENAAFIEGETYQITFNDESYSCVAWANKEGAIVIGNGNIYGGENMGDDVPFSCDSYVGGGFYLNVETEGTYYIKIDGPLSISHKIDHKYLGISPLAIECRRWEKDGQSYTYSCTYDGSRNSGNRIYIDPLPSVSSSSNGMLLGVVNGGWGVVEEGVTSVNGMTGDVVIEAGSGSSVQADMAQNDSTQPDYVKNRTHWVEGNQTVIEWDGSTEGKEVIETDFFSIVKISDLVPAFSEFTKGKVIANGVESDLADVTFIEADGYYGAEDLPLIVTTKPNVIEGDATLPTPGVYHLIVSGMPIITRITYGSTTIHTLDSIYLPDALQIGGEDTTTLIEWDGQVGDKDTFQHDWHMAKVSDLLPTKEDLIGGYYDNYGTQTTITEDIFSESTGCVGVSGRFAVVTELEGQLGNYSYTAPSTGIYFAYSSSSGSVKCGYLKYGEDNITRFDEKFIPLSIARKGEISWNDLLDKPFGTETVEAESFSMQDMEFVDQSSEGGPAVYMYQLSDPFMTLHPDAEYLVNWGGVESTTLCQKLEPYTVLGNVGILADTLGGQVPEGLIATNEDYVIMKMEMNGQYYGTVFITTNSEQYVNITIQGPDHVDHKIDPKYLPTSVGSGLPEVSEEDEGKILQVVGGRWQLVTLVNTEEVEY